MKIHNDKIIYKMETSFSNSFVSPQRISDRKLRNVERDNISGQ